MDKTTYVLYWNLTENNSLNLADTSEMLVS